MALEDEARKYLTKHIAAGRIVTMTPKGKVSTPTAEQVARMTMGALKDTFSLFRHRM